MSDDQLIRILFVEDVPSDVELAERALRKEGLVFTSTRVETKEDFLAALATFQPDLIVSDYTLPEFDGLQALKLSLEHDPALPVILMTGSLNEETAVACIKAGATDYVLKDRITRLPFAVKEALAQKQTRLAKDTAERALRDSEARFREMAEQMVDVLFVTDPRGIITFISPSAARMIGWQPDEMTDRNFVEFLPAAAASQAMDELRGMLDLGKSVRHLDVSMARKDGSTFSAELSISALWKEARIAGTIGIIHDITERKQAENALRQSEELLRVVLTNISDPVFITDDDGQFTFICPNVPATLGYSLENIQALGNISGLVGDGLFIFEELETRGEIANIERVIVDHYGRQRVFLATVKRVSIDRGTILYAFHDITERKRMEQALHEKVIALQTLTEIDREITATMEPKGILELVCRRAAELVHAPKSALIVKTTAAELDMTASYGLFDAACLEAEFAHAQQTGLMNLGALKRRGAIAQNEIPADSPFMPDTVSREGARAIAIVPLAAGEEFLGALIILDTTARQWQADEIQILSMLAGQAALALEKLRLLETARSRALHLATLNEIGQAITSSLDLDWVLITLLDTVRHATEAEACSVALIDRLSGDLVFRQAVGGVPHAVVGLRLPLGEGLAGWVAQHRQSVLVPDMAADARAYKLNAVSGFVTRDLIGAPLIVHDVVTGVIELVNKRTGAFSEDDRRLLEAVAAQAAIAIENARLFEIERAGRESLETLYRIGQAINSTLDADTILDRLTDEAMRTTRATHGSALVAQPERGGFERRSLRGFAPEQVELARADWLPLDRGVNGRAYHSRQPVYVADVRIDPDYHPLIPETRSELVVPILRGGQVIGNLDLQSPEVDAFRDVSLEFLQALTDQVAIALKNAQHFAETRRHMAEMSIVAQVALVGAANRPFDETVVHATNALAQLWPKASLGFFFIDEAAQVLRPHRSYYGIPPELLAALRIPTSQGLIGWAVRERQPVRVGDVTADPRYHLVTPGTRSEMAAPLLAGQRVIGVINVESPALDAFSGEDLRLLTTLAGQLAIIFEKARLDTELIQHAALLEQRVQKRTAELAAANARLQELDRLKSKFVSDVSHELRTPITALSLNVDLLEHGKPEKREKYLQVIRQQVQRETQLVEDILNLSRLELGAEKVRFAPVALNALIAQIVAVHQPAADARNLTLTFTPYSDLPVVRGEENQLAQVITNLIGNAINYTTTGRIEVSTELTDHAVVIEVRDTGLGIAPEDVPHLFERFYRGGRTRNIRGTGLGLAIAREIVDLHDGRLEVESEVDVGSTFRAYLPVGASSEA